MYAIHVKSLWLRMPFLLALAIRHLQSCSATKVKGGWTCSQVSPISAVCCKEFNSLQHYPSDVVAKPTPGHTCATFWSHNLCNIRKKCVASKIQMSHMQPQLKYLNSNCKGWTTSQSHASQNGRKVILILIYIVASKYIFQWHLSLDFMKHSQGFPWTF